MGGISLDDVGKIYPDETPAVTGLTLDIHDGELMVLVGPSGCGKTTALQMVAGLETVSSGEISIGGRVVNNVPAKDRDIAMVFQSYALYPHMTVFENMAFGLRLRKEPRIEIERRIKQTAEVLGIAELLTRKPRVLSGGQRQRVAMGRAIVREPQAFLMDEPLSNLDAQLRVDMRTEISRIQQALEVTTIYVTHDQVEAMTMGDRVAVLRAGQLQQVGTPRQMYEAPVNLFVAGFIGSPKMNFLTGVLHSTDDAESYEVHCGELKLPLSSAVLGQHPNLRSYLNRDVVIGFRPEDVHDPIHPHAADGVERFMVQIHLREDLGPHALLHFSLPASGPAQRDAAVTRLAPVTEGVAGSALFVAQVGPRTAIREAQRTQLGIDTARLHFFDPASGRALPRELEWSAAEPRRRRQATLQLPFHLGNE